MSHALDVEIIELEKDVNKEIEDKIVKIFQKQLKGKQIKNSDFCSGTLKFAIVQLILKLLTQSY